MRSDVYFIAVKDIDIKQRCSALAKLLNETDFFKTYNKNEFVPVKLTLGDSSCIHNIKPELVKLIVSQINNRSAKPFLFDTNVIYRGQRSNAVDHLNLVQNKGFGHTRVGAPFIIADGVLGQDGKEFDIDAENIKKIKIPSFVGMLDNLMVLSHITGHALSIYAGALKNMAMGMACKPTKQVQHSSYKPHVITSNCTSCGCCIDICPADAISMKNDTAFIDQSLCTGCGECLCACKFNAVFINWKEDSQIFIQRLIDVAFFILKKFKNPFFINFALDITKDCDCMSTKNDKALCNIGILASKDILSIDKATVDLINRDEHSFLKKSHTSVYEKTFEYASQKGLGNLEYNLITL